jgi:hypothetical protein
MHELDRTGSRGAFLSFNIHGRLCSQLMASILGVKSTILICAAAQHPIGPILCSP